jgi:hypothetical protein
MPMKVWEIGNFNEKNKYFNNSPITW